MTLTGCGSAPIVDVPSEDTATGSSSAAEAGDAASSATESTGGEKVVTMAIEQAWDSMMPLNTNNNYSRIVYDQVYDRLTMSNADGTFTPRLAESWTINEDSTAITFKLVENATWHDGEPFTAEDVVFSFQMYSDPEVEALSRYHLQYIDGVDDSGVELSEDSINVVANGDYEVTFTFKSPMFPDTFLSDIDTVFIIPKHIFEGKTAEEINAPDLWANPVGTGPFKYASEISGERMEFVKNEDYFQGAPDIDRLVIRVVDSASLLAGLMSGDVDINVIGGIPLQDWEMAQEQENIVTESVPTTSYSTMIMNMSQPYMTQTARQAFSMAINREVLVNSLLQGEGQQIVTPISPISPYFNENIEVWYDPDKAKQMLEEDGFPFEEELVLVTSAGADSERTASLIQQDLQKLGVTVRIQQYDFAALMDFMREGDFDFGMIGSGGTMDPSESREMIAPGSSVNFAHVPDDTLASIIDEANAQLTFDARKPLFDEYQEKIMEISPMAYLYTSNDLIAYNKKLSNVNTANFSNLNLSTWTWEVAE
ncbi:MAG TPA: peptide ABC transporter substrate-binding protein [Candidatus Gallacutalibacter pullicola]|uniref:Peptide ABC transporter substrate-binding protein n=1 Tax=Candidatus Gallacutalibacter pullicola TaxID=2840830 RepID=A0A9D1J246_9FIRM|nr:peptide ABC transporter substrate-binding protein [Candidatus Gallacutalibacter pullicola]